MTATWKIKSFLMLQGLGLLVDPLLEGVGGGDGG